MPESVYDKYNGSSSEEEEESDEEVVLPRRTQQFRVASNPTEAKAAVLSDIRNLAGQQQANEMVVTETVTPQKTEQEETALKQRQEMLKQQEAAKAQQAAALQEAANKVAAASQANQQKGEDYAKQMEEEMRRKAEAARAQAEAEKRMAEERQAQIRAQQEAALKAAQEQTRKAQEEALQKAREKQAQAEAEARAKQQAEAQAKAAAQAKQQAEAKAKAEAEAKARAEAAKAAQAKALADAQAKAAQAKAQAEAQARNAQQAKPAAGKTAAPAPAAPAKVAPSAPPKTTAPTPAAPPKAGAPSPAAPPKAGAPSPAAPPKAGAPSPAAPSRPGAPTTTAPPKVGVAPPGTPSKTAAPTPATPSKAAAPPSKTSAPPPAVPPKTAAARPGMATSKPQPGVMQNNEPAKAPQRTPGKVKSTMPEPKEWEPRSAVEPMPKGTTLRETAKVQEEMLAQEPTRIIKQVGVHAQKPALRLDHVRDKFVEKQEPVPELQSVNRAGVLAGASRWEEEAAARQNADTMGMDAPPPAAVRLQDDACWQTQHRVPVEVQQPQIGKISIPEFNDLHEVQRTVVVAKPQSYQKVKWNEFPEEVTPEIGAAPKVPAQEWKPVNQENSELQRSLYRPAKISRVWPPPQEEITKEIISIRPVKAGDDCGWIQQDPNDVIKSTAWQRKSKIDMVWPPSEGETAQVTYQGPKHMPSVQWPPVESEQHEREQVEVLQKHIPAKKMEYQWPPPPPVYQGDSSTNECRLSPLYNSAQDYGLRTHDSGTRNQTTTVGPSRSLSLQTPLAAGSREEEGFPVVNGDAYSPPPEAQQPPTAPKPSGKTATTTTTTTMKTTMMPTAVQQQSVRVVKAK